MIKTIFRNTFLVGVSVLLLCGLLFFGVQYTQVTDETQAALRQEAAYAEQGLAMNGQAYLERLDDFNRVTWIAADGGVLYDSGDAGHAGREDAPEVAEALASGEGQVIRRSDSTGQDTMYYALRCADGTVLRLARPLSPIRYALQAVSPVMWVLVLVLLISAVLAFRVAKQIVSPINALDLDSPDPDIYPELTPLIQRIQEQKLTIQQEVAQREQLRREFSANVSHELKTPLTSISGMAELMAQGVVNGEKVQEFSGDILKESRRMMALIDDIIRISRLDEGAVAPEWEEVDLRELAACVLESLQPAAGKQEVTLHLEGEPVRVRGVWQLLQEMVYNLCDNAIKYNRPGGSVTVTVGQQDQTPFLQVADTGIGIPAAHQSRVFERFYRVDKSRSKAVGGTGLGLSIVKHGAQYLGAGVSLESTPDVGTTVTLRFPEGGGKPEA